jgi:hypothetical protein
MIKNQWIIKNQWLIIKNQWFIIKNQWFQWFWVLDWIRGEKFKVLDWIRGIDSKNPKKILGLPQEKKPQKSPKNRLKGYIKPI